MADGSTTSIDPRFDPRYQRGYEHSDAAAEGQFSRPARSRASAPAAETPLDDAVEFIQSAVDRAAAADRVAFNRIGSAVGPPSELDDTHPARLDPPATASEVRVTPPEERATAPAVLAVEPDSVHVRPWFIAGWVLTGAVFAIGAWWVWAVYSDELYYSGNNAGSDTVFRQLVWSLAPGLMQVGAIGMVLVTTLAGARQLDVAARPDRELHNGPAASVGGFWRAPAVVALIAIASAAAVVLIWLAGRMAEGSGMSFSNGPSEEDVLQMALSQFTMSAAGPLALTGLGSVLGIVLLGARHAINRADLSARRAR